MAKSAIDERSNFDIISEELRRYGGRQKTSGDSIFICCPFPQHGHEERTPSLGVYMKTEGVIPLGYCHCFGCNARGNWNTLAEVAKLQKIKLWKKSADVAQDLISDDLEQQLLGETGMTFKSVLRAMQCEEAIRWPKHLEWRGFSGSLVYEIGGHIINDARNNSIGLLFPIKINGKVRGGVKAVYEKKENQLGYVNMKGSWTKDWGLFPFMYAAKLIRKNDYRFVVLVEGPRDALRLCSLGIPALAILGATSMSDTKARLVSGLDVDTVYVISDNDNGGNTMYKTVKKFVGKLDAIKLVRLKLPKEYTARGKLIKMDPGNAPMKILKNLMRILCENNGFKIPSKVGMGII